MFAQNMCRAITTISQFIILISPSKLFSSLTICSIHSEVTCNSNQNDLVGPKVMQHSLAFKLNPSHIPYILHFIQYDNFVTFHKTHVVIVILKQVIDYHNSYKLILLTAIHNALLFCYRYTNITTIVGMHWLIVNSSIFNKLYHNFLSNSPK